MTRLGVRSETPEDYRRRLAEECPLPVPLWKTAKVLLYLSFVAAIVWLAIANGANATQMGAVGILAALVMVVGEVKEIQVAMYAVEIVLDTVNAGTNLVDDILYEGVLTDGTRAVIRSIEHTPGRVTLQLGSRESVDDVVADIRSRLAAVSKWV